MQRSSTSTTTAIRFDAEDAGLVPTSDQLPAWGGTDPHGRTLAANSYHLTLDGEPLSIVSGEFIPQRYPADEWPAALRALRDGGCSMVSSYLFWSLVEPRAGEFDFTGANDIGRVAALCAELGLLFAPRIGPFNNSEFLLGGLPPWLYGLPLTERSNDERYLERVRRYFEAVAAELAGQFWVDGGPVVMVQLENELSHAPNDWRTLFGYTATDHRGPEAEDFAAHMAALHRLATEAGINAPFFSMTAWGLPGDVPEGAFLPSYGAYIDLHPHPGDNHVFTTFQGGEYPYRGRYPTLFSEVGSGSPARASYRSRTPADATLTAAFTRLASVESTVLGYYLYHGGTNPVRGDGFGWTTKEPAFPQRSYDFWAPVSEFGERRESFHRLLPFNRFVLEFGTELATAQVVEPHEPVLDPVDDRLRAILRADGDTGFVFLANYGNNHPLSDRPDVSLALSLTSGVVAFPRRSTFAVPSGQVAVLPVGLMLGNGVTLRAATAQPLARLGSDEELVMVFHARTGAEVEVGLAGVAVGDVTGADIDTGSVQVHHEDDGVTVVATVATAREFRVAGPGGSVRVVLIPTSDAEHSVVVSVGGTRVLVSADAALEEIGEELVVSAIRPLVDVGAVQVPLRVAGGAETSVELAQPDLDASMIVIERLGDARVLLTLRDTDVDPTDLWLDVSYTGDLCRLFDAGTGLLIGDDFHRGVPWRIRLGRFADALRRDGLQLRVEPLAEVSDVADVDGILLDRQEHVLGDARVDALVFSERVSATVPFATLPVHAAAATR